MGRPRVCACGRRWKSCGRTTKASAKVTIELTSGFVPEDKNRAVRQDHRLIKGILGLVPQNHCKHERCQRVLQFVKQEAHDAEAEYKPEVKGGAVNGIGSHEAACDDNCPDNDEGNAQQGCKHWDGGKYQDYGDDVRDIHTGDQAS